jgi:GTPase SAR1 family protein
MSESAKTIIKYFCDRFLEIDYYPSNLKTILDLELSNLKDIHENYSKKFQKINVFTFRDLAEIKYSEVEKLAKKANIKKSDFKNALIAAYLIANAWNKRAQYLKNTKMKVVVAGLDYAGKTSLINRLINDHNYNDMINLEPTKGANVEEYQSDRLNLVLWDLGGQKDNIAEYIETPERFFINVDVLIFIFDTQDDARYNDAINYLNEILNILGFLNENPYIMTLLNKADFDLLNDPDFQIKLEYLTEKITDVFSSSNKPWNFEIISTSIYNYYSTEPEIARSIKNIFSKKPSDKGIEFTNIEEKFQKILDVNLKLMDKVVSELAEVKRILFRLSPSDISKSLFSVPFKKIPIDYININEKKNEEDKLKKKTKKESQKQKNKKSKKGIGPPKPLKSLPIPPLKEEEKEKMTSGKTKKVNESLTVLTINPTNVISPPMAPATVVNENNIDLKALRPPPPPPKIVNEDLNLSSARIQILSELKDIFKKRGLVSQYSFK